ncbi:hypothetical protein A5N75_17180 [Prescottella equi]|nr:hypothetical protein A6F56_19685 [Prescottella equi]ORL06614.1 hypothetical protein A6I84_16580 [Prescottella equi]ORL73650.1 hypothetical protein A5N75_17180 [Prescottella equi]ORL88703.1 hypothetical protein A5N76_16915 [Prescottella equi]
MRSGPGVPEPLRRADVLRLLAATTTAATRRQLVIDIVEQTIQRSTEQRHRHDDCHSDEANEEAVFYSRSTAVVTGQTVLDV